MKMIIDWAGPFKMVEPTPRKWYGVIGLYAIEYDSKVIYIGKAEYQGAVKEARSHRGLCERCLRKMGGAWDATTALIYIGTVSEDQDTGMIDHAENLLLYKMQPPCNTQRRERFSGPEPFLAINNGSRPRGLPPQIKYPDP